MGRSNGDAGVLVISAKAGIRVPPNETSASAGVTRPDRERR
jgi:hypothetical protein